MLQDIHADIKEHINRVEEKVDKEITEKKVEEMDYRLTRFDKNQEGANVLWEMERSEFYLKLQNIEEEKGENLAEKIAEILSVATKMSKEYILGRMDETFRAPFRLRWPPVAPCQQELCFDGRGLQEAVATKNGTLMSDFELATLILDMPIPAMPISAMPIPGMNIVILSCNSAAIDSIAIVFQNLELALREARGQVEVLHNRCDDLASQLVIKQTELTQKDLDVARAKKELQELQNLYKQNTEHAAQQAELIQQLQALNTDTQKVLRTQEDAHTAETISYQKLYNELTICFEKLKASEVQLRQNQVPLQDKLFEKEQHIIQLEKQLHEAFCSASSLSYQTYPEPRKGEFQQYSLTELKYFVMSQKTEIQHLQKKLKRTNRSLANHSLCSRDCLDCISTRAGKKYKKPPVKRSRSLSPKSFLKESEELRKLKIAEGKIENLEKALQLKIQENDELRQAHEKRKKRLQMLQINYSTVKNQLKELDEDYGKPGNSKNGKERSDPQHLRQENSDAVWNELAYFKKEHKKLLVENLNLEEELDQMKVHASRDKATIQELNMCLQQEREELLYKLGEEDEVNHSTPKKNVKEISAQTLQKISQLERRIMGFEKESKKLKEINKGLVKDKSELKLLLKKHTGDAEDREKELKILVEKITEAKKDKSKLQLIIDELEKEVTSLKRQVAEGNLLKNENVDLLIQVKQLQSLWDKAKTVNSKATVEAACGQCRCKNIGVNVKSSMA
ncbi:PREDICTED: centlein-like, partial [Thamnophis sirtalis]|uniref:Centlein-like n=1 Tax=Thamnophis sirtalis TaxID=35019 RepID=A0A6I9XB99_9SAUR